MEVLQTGPVMRMLLTRLAFWLALLPSFARCLGGNVPKLFPSFAEVLDRFPLDKGMTIRTDPLHLIITESSMTFCRYDSFLSFIDRRALSMRIAVHVIFRRSL